MPIAQLAIVERNAASEASSIISQVITCRQDGLVPHIGSCSRTVVDAVTHLTPLAEARSMQLIVIVWSYMSCLSGSNAATT